MPTNTPEWAYFKTVFTADQLYFSRFFIDDEDNSIVQEKC
jgi:hypothetical protein